MATTVPTFSTLKWGPERWQVFDYYAHQVRDVGGAGNPCIIHRHGGGGIGGNWKGTWLGSFGLNLFWQYLNSSARAVHFDVIAIESAQRGHSNYLTATPNLPRSKKAWIEDQVLDLKRGVASIKRWAQQVNNDELYMVDASKLILSGDSHGATLAGLAVLTPPILGHGAQSTNFYRYYEPRGYDSTVRACLLSDPQIDVRKFAGIDYMDYSLLPGWWGTRSDNPAEWNALPDRLKESMSIRAYIQRGDVQYYRPFFTLSQTQGDHVHPFVNPHDSQQRLDLNAALSNAKLSYGTLEYGASPSTDDHEAIYNWMVQQISGASISIDAPIPI